MYTYVYIFRIFSKFINEIDGSKLQFVPNYVDTTSKRRLSTAINKQVFTRCLRNHRLPAWCFSQVTSFVKKFNRFFFFCYLAFLKYNLTYWLGSKVNSPEISNLVARLFCSSWTQTNMMMFIRSTSDMLQYDTLSKSTITNLNTN